MTAPPTAVDDAAVTRVEVFLVATVATVLVTRGYLAATGYPQIGGGTLHIAHVLWGGLLMAVALVGVLIRHGSRVRMRAALLGGIGFGLFLDEVGKFLTTDVDYFFRPAVAVMYVVLVAFYLGARVALSRRGPTDRQRLAVGLEALTDLVLGRLDELARRRALDVLAGVRDPAQRELAGSIRAGLAAPVAARTGFDGRIAVVRDRVERRVTAWAATAAARRLVLVVFAVHAAHTLVGLVIVLAGSGWAAEDAGISEIGAELSGAVSAVLIVAGLWQFARRRDLPALRLLYASVVVNLLVTQVFLFDLRQFGALAGFAVSLLLLIVVRVAIRTEKAVVVPGDVPDGVSAPVRQA
ncbi:hypothetical protein [Rhodococcus rhodochrous]|uniref:Membrane protein n=1 Tax=Rhodococcus rhodochrous KG-21 TaxID=1441923 RepID=A0A0M8PKL8_RHORH|nr:hypothetical protein [Rhodococcus rhodochrous]KOS53598.1 membrane protein [Rhodococcus rhodochrous KG-21]